MSYGTKSWPLIWGHGVEVLFFKTLSILICVYKMENNYETLRMPELKALMRECGLRNYSQLRKAELITFLQNNEYHLRSAGKAQAQRQQRPPQMSTWELQREPQTEARQPEGPLATRSVELEAPLTKRQLKRRRNKDFKLAKKFISLHAEIDNLKSQMGTLKDKITKASESINARFKRKKIRSMKREADKIAEKLRESEKALKLLEPRVPKQPTLKQHPLNRNKRIEVKIAEINKKIRRSRNRRNKERLIAKRDSLRLELNWACQVDPASRWGPRQLDGAFSGAYRHYQMDGIEGMDVDTFFARTKRFLIDLLSRETMSRAVHSQATTWIRFIKDGIESAELVFNSRMLAVYNLSDMGEIVSEMIKHMQQQIENPALRDSKFVFDGVIHMDIDFHRLNLTRGSSYIHFQTG